MKSGGVDFAFRENKIVVLDEKTQRDFEKRIQKQLEEIRRLKQERDAAREKKERNQRKKLNEAQTSQLGTFATTWVWERLKMFEPGFLSFDKNPLIVEKMFGRIGVEEDKREYLREACLSVVKSKIQTKRGNVKQSIGDQYISKLLCDCLCVLNVTL